MDTRENAKTPKPRKTDRENEVRMQGTHRVDIAKKFRMWYTVLNGVERKVECNEQEIVKQRRNRRIEAESTRNERESEKREFQRGVQADRV